MTTETKAEWASRVSRLRAVLDLTQDEFAEKLGVYRPTVSLWERGKSLPTRRHREKLGMLEAMAAR